MKQPISDPFFAIADPNRREILMLLSDDSLSINTLAENFEISRPAISKHIKVLDAAGFISIKNVGRKRFCILNRDGFDQLQEWIHHFDEFWEKRLRNLEHLLNEKTGNY